jgi:hypothetical protein
MLEKLMQHQMDPPPPIQGLRPDLPHEVAAIVHTLLAKRPEDRFKSGSALATALDPWSVLDAHSELLKTSGKLPRPAAAPAPLPAPRSPVPAAAPAPVALLVPCTPIPEVANPFNFESKSQLQPPPLPAPAPAAPPPSKKNLPAPPEKPKKRKTWWLLSLAVGLALLVAGVLIASGVFNKQAPPAATEEQVAKDEPVAKKEANLPPADIKALDYYLPPDTEAVAVLNVQHLNQSKCFQDNLLPKFADFVTLLKTGANVDPFKSVERAIVAIPSAGDAEAILVIYGADVARASVLAWAAKLSGATVTPERIAGSTPGTLKDVYCLPVKKDRATGARENLYGAVLSTNPGAIVLSVSKKRVIEALARATKSNAVKFDDPSLRAELAKYPKPDKPVTLWLCAGSESKIFGAFTGKKKDRGTPSDADITGLIATCRLTETMMFELDIEAKSRQAATAGKDFIANFFGLVSRAKKDDMRWARLADLMQKLTLTPKKKDAPNPNSHQWWSSISSDKIAEWLAPFADAKKRN